MANEVNIIIKATDKASKAVGQAQSGLGKLTATIKKHQRAFAIGGAAIVGALAAMTLGAREQVKTQAQLDVALGKIGVSYEENQDSIEGAISSMQGLTGVSDELQRKGLALLIAQTGDLDTAMAALPAAIDFAAETGKDLDKVVKTLGPAITGATNTVSQLGIVFDSTATPAERIQEILDRVGGTAEAMADPIDIAKANFADMRDEIGLALMPILQTVAEALGDVARFIADLDPAIIQTIAVVAALTGGLLLFAAALPPILAGLAALKLVLAGLLGPLGWAALAIGAVVGAVIAFGDEAEDVAPKMEPVVQALDDIAESAGDAEKELTALPTTLESLQSTIATFDKNTGNLRKILQRALGEIPDDLKKALDAAEKQVATQSGFLQAAFDKEMAATIASVRANLGGKFPDEIRSALALADEEFTLGLRPAVDAVDEALSKIPENAKEDIDETVAVLADGADKIADELDTIAVTIEDHADDFDEGLSGPIQSGVDDALAAMAEFEEGVGSAMDNAAQAASDGADSINDSLGGFLGSEGPGAFQFGEGAGAFGGDPSFGFQQGTPFAPGGVALVGEGGPERVVLPRGARVLTNQQTRAQDSIGGGGGGLTNFGNIQLVFPAVTSADEVLLTLDTLGSA